MMNRNKHKDMGCTTSMNTPYPLHKRPLVNTTCTVFMENSNHLNDIHINTFPDENQNNTVIDNTEKSQPNETVPTSLPNAVTGNSPRNGMTTTSQHNGIMRSSLPNGITGHHLPNGIMGSSLPNGITGHSLQNGNVSNGTNVSLSQSANMLSMADAVDSSKVVPYIEQEERSVTPSQTSSPSSRANSSRMSRRSQSLPVKMKTGIKSVLKTGHPTDHMLANRPIKTVTFVESVTVVTVM